MLKAAFSMPLTYSGQNFGCITGWLNVLLSCLHCSWPDGAVGEETL